MLKKLFTFILLSNAISAFVIIIVDSSTSIFGIKFWSDYMFYIFMLLWGMAALFFLFPPSLGTTQSNNHIDHVMESMVDNTASDLIDNERFNINSYLCVKLFLSGIPAFTTCVLLSIFTL